MFNIEDFKNLTQEQKYKNMLLFLKGQLQGEEDIIANLSNASAIVMAMTEEINWAGFYLLKDEELILGPFQGMPACNRIKVGLGVCGVAVKDKRIQRVEDVHKFEGHIACDALTKSELVLPIIKEGRVLGVLDLDSTKINRFTAVDEKYFKEFVDILVNNINF
ncbi:GAF domain-containing protein [Clostridium niameyense]|uniref:GAF domain-containing protein n=1 Tax=Clostridium niameyense TaxID=1622073 RepID=A0A6M0R6F3_9CLOT|nr:GAF domain-containing protein [Clostridium niameyense]NEZ45745.1 GAF domain-containing protein [Clostridium niameyense]